MILDHQGKSNQVQAAIQGGYRIKRRYINMNTAFTYGHKINYEELDDENLLSKIKDKMYQTGLLIQKQKH